MLGCLSDRERPLHEYVSDRREPTGAGALQRASDHDECHASRRRCHDQAAGEHRQTGQIRLRWTVAIGQLAGDDQRNQVGQRVARQRHPVERVAMQLIGDCWQRREHRGDLEGDHRDAENQTDGQQPLLSIESGDCRLDVCHRGEPGATNGHGRARSTDNARSRSNCSL